MVEYTMIWRCVPGWARKQQPQFLSHKLVSKSLPALFPATDAEGGSHSEVRVTIRDLTGLGHHPASSVKGWGGGVIWLAHTLIWGWKQPEDPCWGWKAFFWLHIQNRLLLDNKHGRRKPWEIKPPWTHEVRQQYIRGVNEQRAQSETNGNRDEGPLAVAAIVTGLLRHLYPGGQQWPIGGGRHHLQQQEENDEFKPWKLRHTTLNWNPMKLVSAKAVRSRDPHWHSPPPTYRRGGGSRSIRTTMTKTRTRLSDAPKKGAGSCAFFSHSVSALVSHHQQLPKTLSQRK